MIHHERTVGPQTQLSGRPISTCNALEIPSGRTYVSIVALNKKPIYYNNIVASRSLLSFIRGTARGGRDWGGYYVIQVNLSQHHVGSQTL